MTLTGKMGALSLQSMKRMVRVAVPVSSCRSVTVTVRIGILPMLVPASMS